MSSGGDLPQKSSICASKIKLAPACHRVLNASSIRIVVRALLFLIENSPSMRLNRGAYEGMKSISTPIASAKARTQREWRSTTLSNRTKSPDVWEKSSMIRQSCWCCCEGLLFQQNPGRQLNPLQLEQIISSFSLSPIAQTMGSLHLEYSSTTRPSCPKGVSSTDTTNRRPSVSCR